MSILRLAFFAPLAAALASGCTGISRELSCERNSECVRDGVAGVCMPPGHCAFEDSACPSGYRWDSTADESLADKCVSAGGGDAGPPSDGGDTNACGGTAVLDGAPQSPCGPCDTGTYECAGPNEVECAGAATNSTPVTLLAAGTVQAETTYSSSYEAPLSADADFSTSWFSSGPDADSTPTVYEWVADEEHCIETVTVVGNANHPDFATEFGFGQVTIRVLDADDEATHSESIQLPGTPDPDALTEPDGVLGKRVQLQFLGHEDESCGGFSELLVTELE